MPTSAPKTGQQPVSEPDSLRLSALVDAGPEAISIIDGDWRYVYVNLAFERLSRSSDDIVGKRKWVVFPYLRGTPFENQLHGVMAERQATELEFPGERATYQIHVMPFGDG